MATIIYLVTLLMEWTTKAYAMKLGDEAPAHRVSGRQCAVAGAAAPAQAGVSAGRLVLTQLIDRSPKIRRTSIV